MTKKILTPFSDSRRDPYYEEHGHNRLKVTGDFETRSAINIKKQGGWRYSRDHTTKPLCFSYKLPGETEVKRWNNRFEEAEIEMSPPPLDLFDAIQSGELFEAHNSFFEWAIWMNIMVPQYGWPELSEEQMRCSAAKASYYALPRGLDAACQALRLQEGKDQEGYRTMLQVSKPRKPRKAELKLIEEEFMEMPEHFWYEDYERLMKTFVYCDQDVRTEEALSECLPDLPPRELRIWQMDQRLNRRGVQCDIDLAESAIEVRDKWMKEAKRDIQQITGANTSQSRDAIKAWLKKDYQIIVPKLDAPTLDKLSTDKRLDDQGTYAVNLIKQSNKTSVKKFYNMVGAADPDTGRLHDLMMYHGASRTGRWSGKLVQPHNFPRGDIKTKFDKKTGEIIYDGMQLVCDDIKTRDLAWMRAMYADVIEILSHALRGAFTASPGRMLTVADYAAIEARVVFWLAGDETALDVFRRKEDIYCDLASEIYERVITKDDADERQMGKQGILGLGFNMGAPKFIATCAKYGMVVPRKTAIRVVKLYRKKYAAVPKLWKLMEKSAIECIETGEETWVNEKLAFHMDEFGGMPFLQAELPSGKCLHYPNPHLEPTTTTMFKVCERLTDPQYDHFKSSGKLPEGVTMEYFSRTHNMKKDRFLSDDMHPVREQTKRLAYREVKRNNLTMLSPTPLVIESQKIWFEGQDQKTMQWTDIDTYGGKLTENVVQATARELMAEAMLRCDLDPTFDPVLSVHDEMIGERDDGEGTLDEFIELMTELPDWAEGCPVDAEAWSAYRYRK